MDSYREHPSDFDVSSVSESSSSDQPTVEIGSDERRMHVRAYNYWVSLLNGRDYPSIEDLEPGEVSDFADNSVLLDFTAGRDNPATPYVGTAIREECGLAEGIQSIDEVPSRSLLSRLTDHYMQIIANRAPIGFEAEFVNQRGEPICYRGILMPFSSDGDTIDFIYGVINWKRGEGAPSTEVPPQAQVEAAPQPAVDEDDDELILEEAYEPEAAIAEQDAQVAEPEVPSPSSKRRSQSPRKPTKSPPRRCTSPGKTARSTTRRATSSPRSRWTTMPALPIISGPRGKPPMR